MLAAVTGATGHIGINLVRQLISEGYQVRACYHTPRHRQILTALNVDTVAIDVTQPESLQQVFNGCDVVFHCAGIISLDGDANGQVTRVNVNGAMHVAKAALAARVKRLVHLSSIHSFNREPRHLVVNESRQRVQHARGSHYDFSKACGEAAVRTIVQQGLDAVILHPTGVLGPNDYRPSHLGQTLLGFYQRRIPMTIAGGFNFVHVDDVVKAMLTAAHRGVRGDSYIIAGHWHSIRELADMVAKITSSKAPSLNCPLWLARSAYPIHRFIQRVLRMPAQYTPETLATLRALRQIDDSKARRELNHQPSLIHTAIADWFRWYTHHQGLDS